MGIHQHIPSQPRSETGGSRKKYSKEKLDFIEVTTSGCTKSRKVKTKRDKRAKQDEGVVIIFHDVAKSMDVPLTMAQTKQRIRHYETVGKPTATLEKGLREAKRLRHG